MRRYVVISLIHNRSYERILTQRLFGVFFFFLIEDDASMRAFVTQEEEGERANNLNHKWTGLTKCGTCDFREIALVNGCLR